MKQSVINLYFVYIKVKNGGETRVFSTFDRKQAACFVSGKNKESIKLNSPNRYFFTCQAFTEKELQSQGESVKAVAVGSIPAAPTI